MGETALSYSFCGHDFDLALLEGQAEGWLLDGEIRQHSRQTLAVRRIILDKLFWFLRTRGHDVCGRRELRLFLAYLSHGHEEEGGRWGNPHLTRQVRPRTVKDYHGHLRTFFKWMVAEGTLDKSPMDSIAAPLSRSDQVQPFTESHVEAVIAAARRTTHARRDEAIVLFLLDTGVRASELCGLRMTDLDLANTKCTVLGKGNKRRSVCFGRLTARAVRSYLSEEPRGPEDPLFLADRGTRHGDPLTRSGLLQLIERLGKKAAIQATRCSPHTFRHTFAVSFLRNGGNAFTLQQILGHTNLTMTNRYVALAQADIEHQHRLYSPVDALRRGIKR